MHPAFFSARTLQAAAQSVSHFPAKHAIQLGLSIAGLMLLTGCVSLPKEAPPAKVACPEGVPAGTECLRGQDSAGSHYLIATPAKWSGVLVVHAHGGPALGEPKASRV